MMPCISIKLLAIPPQWVKTKKSYLERWCLLNAPISANLRPHSSHAKGRSPKNKRNIIIVKVLKTFMKYMSMVDNQKMLSPFFIPLRKTFFWLSAINVYNLNWYDIKIPKFYVILPNIKIMFGGMCFFSGIFILNIMLRICLFKKNVAVHRKRRYKSQKSVSKSIKISPWLKATRITQIVLHSK